MSNLSFDVGLLKEHAPEPLEGHHVVVFERVGAAGERLHSVLGPGDPRPRSGWIRAVLGRRLDLFAVAVNAAPQLHISFSEHVVTDDHLHEFDLSFDLRYRVDDPRLAGRTRNADPLGTVCHRVGAVIAGEMGSLPWEKIWNSFRSSAAAVVQDNLSPLRAFASEYGLEILSIGVSPRAVEADTKPLREIERIGLESRKKFEAVEILRKAVRAGTHLDDLIVDGVLLAPLRKSERCIALAASGLALSALTMGLLDLDEDALDAALADVGVFTNPPPPAHARVDAPEVVVAQAEFEVTIGIAPRQSAGVVGEAMEFPPSTAYPFVLVVQVVAEGMEVTDGGGYRREMTATEDAPYPSVLVPMRAEAQEEPVRARALKVIYSVAGQTIGYAVRPIATLRTPADRAAVEPVPALPAADVRVPAESIAPDLTLHILRAPDTRGRLRWTWESPHARVARPADGEPLTSDIGEHPREFAKALVRKVDAQRDAAAARMQLQGIGKAIAGRIPEPVWDAIQATATAAGGVPTILILSDEPYVPWELAVLRCALPVPDAPPFLGAQAHVGRWMLGHPAPPLPPPHELSVRTMAVVWGDYAGSPWEPLEGARAEAAELGAAYGAEMVDATLRPVLRCLEGTPPADALHFSLHGVYNPGAAEDGLILADNAPVDPLMVSGADLARRPLVFLNACQVGSGQEVLGSPAGMACAFLDARASAVIAPLWSVEDDVAKEVSLSFYREAFSGTPVGAALRRLRAQYGEGGSTTWLAYQYFGHPGLRLRRGETGIDRTDVSVIRVTSTKSGAVMDDGCDQVSSSVSPER